MNYEPASRGSSDLAANAPGAQERRTGTIRIANVVKIYGSEGAGIRAVDDCTFDVPAGKITVVVGPSGCGKTTLLNAIAGFHSITSGTIYLDDTLLCGPEPAAGGSWARIASWCFRTAPCSPGRPSLTTWRLVRSCRGASPGRNSIEKARFMLAELGLRDFESNYPGEISSGMRRRVEIARALMNDPKVLLLDEPYRALDSLTKSVMHEALLETFDRNQVTIFFITHDLEEAIFLGHHVVIMTTRPCRPKKILTVDIPHPRDYSILTAKRFREYLDETVEAVHEEALKAFAAGERER